METHDMIMEYLEHSIKHGYKPTAEDLKRLETWHAEKAKRESEAEKNS